MRDEFPVFKQLVYGKRLAYLDSAATAQKPQCVIDAVVNAYSNINGNVHRSMHYLSDQATQAFEATRIQVKNFINAKQSKECIFVRGTTEAINLVASSYGEQNVHPGDEILISGLEHHSNIIPWQMLCQKKDARLKVIPLLPNGELDLSRLDDLLTDKTKILAITYVSNALGTVTPLKKLIDRAHAKQAVVVVDGAQAVPHLKIDVQELNCDFFAFSSHKMYGPTGVGILYGKESLLNAMPPYQGGGEMMITVTHENTIYNEIPYKFEAGTPAIAEVIGLGRAIQFIEEVGFPFIKQQEQVLLHYATQKLQEFPEIKLIGTAAEKISVISFVMAGIHPHDIATIFDQYGVAVRGGRHCAMPLMDYFGLPATVRISFGLYNTMEDIEQMLHALKEVIRVFKKQRISKYQKEV